MAGLGDLYTPSQLVDTSTSGLGTLGSRIQDMSTNLLQAAKNQQSVNANIATWNQSQRQQNQGGPQSPLTIAGSIVNGDNINSGNTTSQNPSNQSAPSVGADQNQISRQQGNLLSDAIDKSIESAGITNLAPQTKANLLAYLQQNPDQVQNIGLLSSWISNNVKLSGNSDEVANKSANAAKTLSLSVGAIQKMQAQSQAIQQAQSQNQSGMSVGLPLQQVQNLLSSAPPQVQKAVVASAQANGGQVSGDWVQQLRQYMGQGSTLQGAFDPQGYIKNQTALQSGTPMDASIMKYAMLKGVAPLVPAATQLLQQQNDAAYQLRQAQLQNNQPAISAAQANYNAVTSKLAPVVAQFKVAGAEDLLPTLLSGSQGAEQQTSQANTAIQQGLSINANNRAQGQFGQSFASQLTDLDTKQNIMKNSLLNFGQGDATTRLNNIVQAANAAGVPLNDLSSAFGNIKGISGDQIIKALSARNFSDLASSVPVDVIAGVERQIAPLVAKSMSTNNAAIQSQSKAAQVGGAGGIVAPLANQQSEGSNQNNPVSISKQSELNALPKGSWYKTPNGKVLQK